MGAIRGYRFRRHHLTCYGFHCCCCFFCCTKRNATKCVRCARAIDRAHIRIRVHFLFTRLTNVGVFVELLASATDTLGCGDADDDRIYNKDRSKKGRQKKDITESHHQNRKITL